MSGPGGHAPAGGPAHPARPGLGCVIRHLSAFLLKHPASRGARGASVMRAIAWQLAYRLGRSPALVECAGMKLWVHPGSTAASGVLYVGLPEWEEMNFVLRCLRPGEHFGDVGANVGSFTVLAGCRVANLRVTAVEPGEPALTRLRANLALNRLAGVRVVDCAVGDAEGTIAFTRGRDTVNRIALEADAERVTVRLTTLDALFESDPPALLKIDVEGAELRVLRGATRLLSGPRPPILLLEWIDELAVEAGAATGEIVSLLHGHGYRLATYDADANQLEPWEPGRPTRLQHRVAARDLEALASRLAEGEECGVRAPVRVRMRLAGRESKRGRSA